MPTASPSSVPVSPVGGGGLMASGIRVEGTQMQLRMGRGRCAHHSWAIAEDKMCARH